MRQFNAIMLDIETMGNQSDSAILSIAAVEFDIETGETGDEFYENIDLQSCLNAGLTVNASTIYWWLKQDDHARKSLCNSNPLTLVNALDKFSDFCSKKSYYVWANSPVFDCAILKNAYDKIGFTIPWKFWNERDVRTLVSFAPDIKNEFVFEGTAHNALDDCKYQIGYCHEIWKHICK